MQIQLTLDETAAQAVLKAWKEQRTELDRRIEDLESKLTKGTRSTNEETKSTVDTAGKSSNYDLVYAYLKQHGRSGVTQIANAIGKGKTSVSSVVHARPETFSGRDGTWDLVENEKADIKNAPSTDPKDY